MSEAEKNEGVKVVIVQGAGDKSFAAGADIKDLNARKPLKALNPGCKVFTTKLRTERRLQSLLLVAMY
ncbi:enoyl-CoA hydratase/isomerase family protein [Jeotgalibacillus marinus]|uniref:Enoyl-CoA hydratase/isomerase family protein n=1 Tax=Jeotgalibacillus marinus TaxID=86667 RepID=A0ABV3Q2F9_9BACL